MISVRYREFVEILIARRRVAGIRTKLTRKEISEKSGVQLKILSKIAADPKAEITLETINKLTTYFFQEFCKTPPDGVKSKKQVLDWVWRNLLEFIPDEILPKLEMRSQILERDPVQVQIRTRDELVDKLFEIKK